MDTQTQIDRLIELAIVQRTELRRLVQELPQLKEHLSAEIERTFEEAEPQMRAELEEYVTRQADDKTATLGAELSKEIKSLAAALEESAQAKFSAILAARDQNADLLKQAEERIAEAAGQIPAKVKDIVTAELARFPRAGEIDRLRKEFQEPRGLNPRGKWTTGERYNKLDLVSFNGDSFVSNIDGNTEKPNRSSEVWTLSAARGVQGGGGGITSLVDLYNKPSPGEVLIGNGTDYQNATLTAGEGITITNGSGSITIDASVAQGYLNLQAKNGEASAITRGQVVYISGASGSLPQVKLAINTGDITSTTTIGVVADASIAPGDTGVIRCVGEIKNVNTSSFNAGDLLYLGGTAGSITNVKPVAPAHMVQIGICEKVNAVSGEIYVFVQNGYELDELHNVLITSVQNGQTLVYDSATQLWKNSTTINGTSIPASKTLVVTTDKLSALASTTSAELAGVISDETGSGSLVFANTPTLVTPNIGAATGTSAVLTGNVTSPDHIFGTSGPSAKSSIAARAARQGLVFDGTAGATVSVAAFGTADFTISAWINATALADNKAICDGLNSLGIWLKANGAIQLWNRVGGAALYTSSASTIATGKSYLITYARGRLYVNGIDVSGAITDTTNYSGGITAIGDVFNTGAPFSGFISVSIYNRALSAAEVVSLYEAGVPSGADYATPAATNTSLSVNAWTNSSLPYSTFSGASATGFTAAQASATTAYAYSDPAFTVKAGTTIRVKFTATLTSGQAPLVRIDEIGVAARSANYSVSAGSNTIDIVATSGGTVRVIFLTTVAASYAISSLTATPLGLLLAPDAAQAGGGLTWYDTSGNAANITLPASGVTWNVPSSGTLASGVTNGNVRLVPNGTGYTSAIGTLSLGVSSANDAISFFAADGSSSTSDARLGLSPRGSTTIAGLRVAMLSANGVEIDAGLFNSSNGFGTSKNLFLNVPGGNVLVGTTTDNATGLLQVNGTIVAEQYANFAWRTSKFLNRLLSDSSAYASTISGDAFAVLTNNAERMIVGYNGNVLVGTTTDGGQKLQVAGTGIVKGNFYAARSDNTGSIQLIPTSGVSAGSDIESFNGSTSAYGRLNTRGTHLQVYTGTSANTLALTVDDSQNATFAGKITTNAISGINALAAGTQLATFESSVNGAAVELITKGKNSTGTARAAYIGLNRFADDVLSISDGTTERLRLGLTNGNLTVTGALKLGNAYVAGAPTATGYVTIQDSAGNTYKVLVGT